MRSLHLHLIIPALLVALVASPLVAAPAHASHSQLSVFEDEGSLLYSGDGPRNRTLDELQKLGVDVVRANVLWRHFAPSVNSTRKPKGFNASDPNAYPFFELDALVAAAQARGISLLLTPTVPGPDWARGGDCSSSGHKARSICKPSPREYAAFVTALGRRYPTVHMWSIGNEPNLGSWLRPQYIKHGGSIIPYAPTVYRALVRAATGALGAAGHKNDQILIGETAPVGQGTGPIIRRGLSPETFFRELFCLNSRGGRLTGSGARIRGCNHYTRLAVTGIAHHPYTRSAGESLNHPVRPGDITLANISKLFRLIDQGARRGRIPAHLPVWSTEFGFQSNPPDRIVGTSLSNQAKWLNQADWMAWRNGRIRSVAQYEMRDEPNLASFQSGLRFKNLKEKPAYAAYRLPIWPTATRGGTRVWLQVRPESLLHAPQKITLQYRRGRSGSFKTLKTFTVLDRHGFMNTSTGIHAQYWRFLWNGLSSRVGSTR